METYALRRARLAAGLSLKQVADTVGTNPANLMRVEKGQQLPKQALARALWRFYRGAVPLELIYDPTWESERPKAPTRRALERGVWVETRRPERVKARKLDPR